MSRAVIIGSYPNGNKERNILKKCIASYKDSGYSILVVTHYPLDMKEIDADYVIYDKNNEFLPAHYTPFYWLKNGDFKVEIYNAGHTLPICRNLSHAFNLCRSVGITEFIFTEADVILTEADRNKLFVLMDTMKAQDKKMLFFRPEEYRDCGGSYVYETVFFGGNTEYFLNTFRPPLNLEEWLSIPMGYTLELSFYERFSRDEEKFILIHNHSSNYFSESQVNLLRYGLFNCELVHNEKDENRPILFIMNSLISGKPMSVEIWQGQHKESHTLHKNQYWMNSYQRSDNVIIVIVKEEDEIFLERVFNLNETSDNLKKKGIIKYE